MRTRVTSGHTILLRTVQGTMLCEPCDAEDECDKTVAPIADEDEQRAWLESTYRRRVEDAEWEERNAPWFLWHLVRWHGYRWWG